MVRMRVKIIAFEGEPIKVSNQYLFYKQFKFGECKQNVKHLSLGQFFFAQISPNDDPCIGELQLLYEDKLNHECLASIRLYFLPEQSPDGRQPRHGEHEVLAASEKVIIRLHDLVTWITDEVVWLTGLEVPCDACPLLQPFSSFTKTPINLSDKSNAVNIRQGASSMSTKFSRGLDFSDIEAEKSKFCNTSSCGPSVIVISYPRYCRYRALLKRLEGKKNDLINKENTQTAMNSEGILPSFHQQQQQQQTTSVTTTTTTASTILQSHQQITNLNTVDRSGKACCPNVVRILFCRETFEHEGLLHHELNCEYLAPKLKGRPRKKGIRSQRSSSPESNTSEETKSTNEYKMRTTRKKSSLKAKNSDAVTSALPSSSPPPSQEEEEESKTDLPLKSIEKCLKNEQEFIKQLYKFMKEKNTPIQRIPHLGFKKIDLFYLYTYAQKLGGYDKITCNKLWKRVYDELGGDPRSTSAATCTRRHYERLLLPFERYINYLRGKDRNVKQKLPVKRGKNKAQQNDEPKDSNNNTQPHIPKKRGRKPKYLKVQMEKELEESLNTNSSKESSISPSIGESAVDAKNSTGEELSIGDEMQVNDSLSKQDAVQTEEEENDIDENEAKSKEDTKKNVEIKIDQKPFVPLAQTENIYPPTTPSHPPQPQQQQSQHQSQTSQVSKAEPIVTEKSLDEEKTFVRVKEEPKPFLEPLRIVRKSSIEQSNNKQQEVYVCVKDTSSTLVNAKRNEERITELIPTVKPEVIKFVSDEKNNGICDNFNGATSKSPLMSITSLIASMESKSLSISSPACTSDKTAVAAVPPTTDSHSQYNQPKCLSSNFESNVKLSMRPSVIQKVESFKDTLLCKPCMKVNPTYTSRETIKDQQLELFKPPLAHTVSAVKRNHDEIGANCEILDLSVKKRFSEADSRTSPSKPLTDQHNQVHENGEILDLSLKKRFLMSQSQQQSVNSKPSDSFPVQKVPKKITEEALPQSHVKVTPIKPQIVSNIQSQQPPLQNQQLQQPPKLVPNCKETYYPNFKSSRNDLSANSLSVSMPNGSTNRNHKSSHNTSFTSYPNKQSTTPTPPVSSALGMPPALVPTHPTSKICQPSVCERTLYEQQSARHHTSSKSSNGVYGYAPGMMMRHLPTSANIPSISEYNPTLPTFHMPFEYLSTMCQQSPISASSSLQTSNPIYHQNGAALRAISAPLMSNTFTPLHPLTMDNVAYRKLIEQKTCVYPYFVTK